MKKKITTLELETLFHINNEDLVELIVQKAKDNGIKLSKNAVVNFRWGETDMDKVFATIDVVKKISKSTINLQESTNEDQ